MRLGLLDGQVVLVSGGTGGIGAACATEVTTEGAEAVVVTGRNVERGSRVVTMIKDVGTPALFIPTDLSDAANAQASVHETIRAFGRVDCVVNVAGLTARGTMLSTDSQLFDALIAVNLKAPFFIMREAIADMRRKTQRRSNRQYHFDFSPWGPAASSWLRRRESWARRSHKECRLRSSLGSNSDQRPQYWLDLHASRRPHPARVPWTPGRMAD
jgi:NAD(P)-dependent dehydrogenase (short-subunit alcohol dehydrogenase family)